MRKKQPFLATYALLGQAKSNMTMLDLEGIVQAPICVINVQETSKQAIRALSNAFEGVLVQPTHIFEQYAQLFESSKHAALGVTVQQRIHTQRRQLLLAARMMRYSVSRPLAQLAPLNAHAFLWESIGAPLSGSFSEQAILCDAALLQPLLQEYAHQTQSLSAAPLSLIICESVGASLPCEATFSASDALLPNAEMFKPAHEWLSKAAESADAPRPFAAYELCFGYASLIESIHKVGFSPIMDGKRMAMQLRFDQAKPF